MSRSDGLRARHGTTRSCELGHGLYRQRFLPHVSQQRPGQRPRLGQPPPHSWRGSQRPKFLWGFPDAHRLRTGRYEHWPLDSHHRDRPILCHPGHLVRRGQRQSHVRLPQYWPFRLAEFRFYMKRRLWAFSPYQEDRGGPFFRPYRDCTTPPALAPAMNRWAILGRPCGTQKTVQSRLGNQRHRYLLLYCTAFIACFCVAAPTRRSTAKCVNKRRTSSSPTDSIGLGSRGSLGSLGSNSRGFSLP